MRIIDKYHNQGDEFFHPLWLGILILFSVITIIGTLCCLRIKYGSQLRNLLNRLSGRKSKKNENSINDDNNSISSYSYNWPPFYTPTKNQSPKLYTLVKNIQTAKLIKQLSLKQQSSNEDENDGGIHLAVDSTHLQTSLPPSINDVRSFEIARKFYASMRNTNHRQNSSSFESYNNDASIVSNNPSPIIEQPIKNKREENIKLFHTPYIF